MKDKLTRRDILHLSSGFAAGAVLGWLGYPLADPDLPKAISRTDWWRLNLHLGKELVIKSFGTMKDSRDRFNEDPPPDNQEIAALIAKAKAGGARQVDINTPYDPEFRASLREWVSIAHGQGLGVILRGNFARTEGMYTNFIPENERFTTIKEHVTANAGFLKTELSRNPDFLIEGDWFNPAPEPENAKSIIGDYWQGGRPKFREYVSQLYYSSRKILDAHGKQNVGIIFGHNADVALDQDLDFWRQTGNIVGIDNNVATIQEMAMWCQKAKDKFPGVKIVMLEYGAPTDRTGEMDEHTQALFVFGLLNVMITSGIDGFNYQTLNGGTTTLLNRMEIGDKVVFEEKEAFKVTSFVYSRV